MPYSTISPSKASGKVVLTYLFGSNGHGHNGFEKRNMLISGIGLLPGSPVLPQFDYYWMRKGRKNQSDFYTIIQSFSSNELDINNPDDISTAHKIGRELAEKHYATDETGSHHRQIIIFTQIDSGYVHNHIAISSVDMDECKSLNKDQTNLFNVRKWTDEISKQYFELDFGANHGSKEKKTERHRREKGLYVLKDDIRERVKSSIEEATSEEDFYIRCRKHGIIAEKKYNKRDNKYHFTYTLIDLSDDARNYQQSRKGYLKSKPLKSKAQNLADDENGDIYDYDALQKHLGCRMENDTSSTSDSSNAGTGKDSELSLCVDNFIQYATGMVDTKNDLMNCFDATSILMELNSKIRQNQIQINSILGFIAVYRVLQDASTKKIKIYMRMLYDLIDEQRKLKQKKVNVNIEEQKRQQAKKSQYQMIKRTPKRTLTQLEKDIQDRLKEMNHDGSEYTI